MLRVCTKSIVDKELHSWQRNSNQSKSRWVAALGVITLVFQHGWFGAQPGPIEAFIPALIFAIVFGLSMDYEVFLVSRIHEVWMRTKDPSQSVREGLASTGKVITAAAAIVPAVIQMLGKWAWWLPAPLARKLPKVSIERPEHS
jgi:RND superfamily putative drug exporter